MVMMGAAMVQLSALMMAVRHVFVVVAIGFPSVTGLLKLMDDLIGVLMMIIMIEVVVVMSERVVLMTKNTARCCPINISFRDDSAEHRMVVSEGTSSKRTAMSM